MEDARKALERAKDVLDGINVNIEIAGKIGEALGEIGFALIALDAYEEVYGFRRCNRTCVDRRTA